MSRGRFVVPGSPDHQAMLLNNQACDLCRMGKYEEAKPLFVQALAIWEKHFGETSLPVATCHESLVMLAGAIGDFDDAIVHCQNAVRILDKLPNVDPGEHATFRGILARLQASDGVTLESFKDVARRSWTR